MEAVVSETWRVGVVGAGQMGAGIAEVCARSGADVLIYEPTRDLVVEGRSRVLRSLERGVSSGKLTEREREQAASRLRFTSELGDFADRRVVCEAVVEDDAVKTEIFAALDKIVSDPSAVLASNTSSIPIVTLAMATRNPSRVIGLHFFNPVPVLPLVELVSTLHTDTDIVTYAEAFADLVLGKQVIRSADRSGFVVNAMLVPYLLSAIRLVENGFAQVEDVDKGMVLGCAHPMGPLRLADLVGLDTVKDIADRMYAESKEALYAPTPLLLRMVAAGHLGKKSGQGFYRYADGDSTLQR
ncbi:3-hydroxybutyryl-CoA dehydrogenase [Gordonia aichiensis]|uniref:3-hydroxybutyryl-CoA dehydrogenase n=1 Tax=Gordonia aichiensis NBRC 108223 TaxID=1220583 RepID=L7KGX1_9ACTN|nr:3-hydroxybutyryl-CoA dehydrogenase [Gordonia aichiensis]GAC47869.1 3-hydroxybutyryl-CoA dehydrogenase [Gordonia aichiensis NBRC 108223]